MKVLALETATPFLVVGLLEALEGREALSFEQSERVERAHAERVVDSVQAAFQNAGVEPRADLIVVGTGPGSYTGVRVGASLALGLARAWKASVIGVPTLEAIAVQREGTVAVTLDARKGNVYGAVYRVSGLALLEPVVPIGRYALEEFKRIVPNDAQWLRDESPSGLGLARIGFERYTRGEGANLELNYL